MPLTICIWIFIISFKAQFKPITFSIAQIEYRDKSPLFRYTLWLISCERTGQRKFNLSNHRKSENHWIKVVWLVNREMRKGQRRAGKKFTKRAFSLTPSQACERVRTSSRALTVKFIFILFKNFTVTLKCKLKEKIINDSRNRKVSRRCTNRYLQCKHGAVQPVQTVCSGTIASNK